MAGRLERVEAAVGTALAERSLERILGILGKLDPQDPDHYAFLLRTLERVRRRIRELTVGAP